MNTELLEHLYKIRNDDPCYGFTSKKEHGELLEAGYVEVDPDCHNGKNGFARKIATHITETGVKYFEKEFGIVEEISDIETVEKKVTKIKPKEKSKMSFEIKTASHIPPVIRKYSPRESKYPFDQLEVNQYFEVEGDDVVRKIQSAMAAANKRWSEETNEMKVGRKGGEVPVRKPIRKFVCRATETGAAVYRVM